MIWYTNCRIWFNMVYHSTHSDEYLWTWFCSKNKNKKTKTHPITQILLIFNGRNNEKVLWPLCLGKVRMKATCFWDLVFKSIYHRQTADRLPKIKLGKRFFFRVKMVHRHFLAPRLSSNFDIVAFCSRTISFFNLCQSNLITYGMVPINRKTSYLKTLGKSNLFNSFKSRLSSIFLNPEYLIF